MRKRKKENLSRTLQIYIIAATAAVLLVVTLYAYLSIERSLNENLTRRACSDLETAAENCRDRIENDIEEQYRALENIAVYLTDNETVRIFAEKNIAAPLALTRGWRFAGFAGTNGSLVRFTGESCEGYTASAGFRAVAAGEAQRFTEYITGSPMFSDSGILFSVPVVRNGDIAGVLFAGKECGKIESFMEGEPDSIISLAVVNLHGEVLAADAKTRGHLGSGNHIFPKYPDGSDSELGMPETLSAAMENGESGYFSFRGETGENLVYMPFAGENWYMFAMAEQSALEAVYAENIQEIRRTVSAIMVMISLLLTGSAIAGCIQLHNMAETEKKLRLEQKRNIALLEATDSEQFVYDLDDGMIRSEGAWTLKNGGMRYTDLDEVARKHSAKYPDAELEEVYGLIRKSAATGEQESLDRPIPIAGKIRWVKLTVVPYKPEGSTVKAVFGSMTDVSYLHEEFERNAGLLQNLPGGFRRCLLTDPVVQEYSGEGYARMLGLTQKEINALPGGGGYPFGIYKEDIPKVGAFLERLRAKPHIETIDYRLVKADGSLITVSDTTESICEAGGVMRGYSTLVDVTAKAKELAEAKVRAEESKAREQAMRSELRLLAAAARSGFSLIISGNLTRNTYHVFDESRHIVHYPESGVLDVLVSEACAKMPDKAAEEEFFSVLGRRAITEAYQAGKREVRLRHRESGEDGSLHWVDSQVIFIRPDTSGGDVTGVMFSKVVDEEQERIEENEALSRKEAVYRDAVMEKCVSFIEVNLTTGYVVKTPTNLNHMRRYMTAELELPEESNDYDDMVRWVAENILISDKKTYMRTASREYLTERYALGHHYEEFTFTIRNHETGAQNEMQQIFYLTMDETTGDLEAICVLNDVTELVQSRRDIKALSEELEKTRIRNSVSQMQPHFLYNALASIREIILDDPQYAAELIFDFTTYLRACVRTLSSSELIPFSREMENIRAYVNIEKMRFGDRLEIRTEVKCEDFMIVPLSIQPLVENAIRHGIYQRGAKGGCVSVTAERDGDRYLVSVKDNGAGFDYEIVRKQTENGGRDSTGLRSVIFRLEKILNATVDICSTIGTGTEITVGIPVAKTEGAGK